MQIQIGSLTLRAFHTKSCFAPNSPPINCEVKEWGLWRVMSRLDCCPFLIIAVLYLLPTAHHPLALSPPHLYQAAELGSQPGTGNIMGLAWPMSHNSINLKRCKCTKHSSGMKTSGGGLSKQTAHASSHSCKEGAKRWNVNLVLLHSLNFPHAFAHLEHPPVKYALFYFYRCDQNKFRRRCHLKKNNFKSWKPAGGRGGGGADRHELHSALQWRPIWWRTLAAANLLLFIASECCSVKSIRQAYTGDYATNLLQQPHCHWLLKAPSRIQKHTEGSPGRREASLNVHSAAVRSLITTSGSWDAW